MVEAHPEEGEEPARFKGSVVVYTGESADEVRKILESDAYAIGNVWDTANIQIIPVRPLSCNSISNMTADVFAVVYPGSAEADVEGGKSLV